MGEDVEEPAARRRRQRLEVARPHRVGAAPALPDVEAIPVDGEIAEEVDRADHVVKPAALDQVLRAILAPGHEVDLEPEPQVGLARARTRSTPRCRRSPARARTGGPRSQALIEAVDVLGDPELGDPRGVRRVAVALDVRGAERIREGRVAVIGAQVDVVVGQHAGDSINSTGEQQLGDVQVQRRRHLQVLGAEPDDPHHPPAALDERGLVGGGVDDRRREREGAHQRGARERLRSLHGPQSRAVDCARDPSPEVASLIVSLTGVAAIAQSTPVEAASTASISAGVTSGRPRRARGSGRRPRAPRRSAAAHGCRADLAARRRREPAGASAPAGSATTITLTAGTARSAAMLHSSIGRPASSTSALGPGDPSRSPRPAATTSATAIAGPAAQRPRAAVSPLGERDSSESR